MMYGPPIDDASATPSSAHAALSRPFRLLAPRHQISLIVLWILAIAFGTLTEIRGALLHNRHTDAGTYFSAAWSIRIGSDPYFAQDRNGWHYNYPLPLAALMSPLADAPPAMRRYWLMPFALSVGIWYVLSIAFLAVGADRLARAVVRVIPREPSAPDESSKDPGRAAWPVLDYGHIMADALPPPNTPARSAWRWWVLCFWPVALCVPAIVRSVIRGQVGPLWLMLLCMTAACIVERKPIQAGAWLAAAICLKLIPAFLLIYPLWRRDWRMFGGCAIGLIVGLLLIPWSAMGTGPFVEANSHYVQSFLLPGMTGGRIDPAVEHELVNPVTSDTESFKAILMNVGAAVFHTPRSYTPPLFARVGAWVIGGAMTAVTLAAAGFRPKREDPIADLLLFALLSIVVLPIAPVCHPHYFMLMILLVIGVLAAHLGPQGRRISGGWITVLATIPLSHVVTGLMQVQRLRDAGLDTWVAVLLWAAAARLLFQRCRVPSSDDPSISAFAEAVRKPSRADASRV
jgi:hypothetical protein